MTSSTKDARKDDYWAPFEGIPLCHTPRTKAEWQELEKKGACTCG